MGGPACCSFRLVPVHQEQAAEAIRTGWQPWTLGRVFSSAKEGADCDFVQPAPFAWVYVNYSLVVPPGA